MYVKTRMNSNVISIFPDSSISLAFQLMSEQGYAQLPVVKNEKYVGMITDKLLTEVSPSKATSLSMYELNYLLSKTKVKDIMNKDAVTGSPDMLIEEAAVLMREKNADALPIVDESNKLLGILTRTDIMDAFIELMGFNDSGTRIALEVKDEPGVLANISDIIRQLDISINHISIFSSNKAAQMSEMIIQVNTLDTEALLSRITEKGYSVISVQK